MTYVVAEPCIGQKNTACVDVCPVDCIHPTPDEPGFTEAEMVFIDPDECIDCGVCAEACPVEACLSDVDLPPDWESFAGLNAAYFGKSEGDSHGG
jgi:NAD-dependent dihydropyrimidine dehydrogenase PreA subunit